jgi:hypothetical protein
MKRPYSYLISFIVLIASSLITYFLTDSNLMKGAAIVPAVLSLVFVLYKTWKDEELQNRQQDFILGTASHMAEVAYDKHVLFCEKYIERVEKGRQELFRDGVSKNCINIGRDLKSIRYEFSPWLTKEIEEQLRPFENVLVKIGAQEGLLRSLEVHSNRTEVNDKRNEVVNEMYRSFGLVLGQEKALTNDEAEISIDKVVDKIRDILGIKILTTLRIEAANLAYKRLKN